MKAHVRIYLTAAGKLGDRMQCEMCGREATDIHHIQRRGMGGSKTADRAENLMALCRQCHEQYGDKRQYKEMLQARHNDTVKSWSIAGDLIRG